MRSLLSLSHTFFRNFFTFFFFITFSLFSYFFLVLFLALFPPPSFLFVVLSCLSSVVSFCSFGILRRCDVSRESNGNSPQSAGLARQLDRRDGRRQTLGAVRADAAHHGNRRRHTDAPPPEEWPTVVHGPARARSEVVTMSRSSLVSVSNRGNGTNTRHANMCGQLGLWYAAAAILSRRSGRNRQHFLQNIFSSLSHNSFPIVSTVFVSSFVC